MNLKRILTIFLIALTTLSFGKSKIYKCIKPDGSVVFELEAKYTYDFADGLAKVKIQWYENNEWHTKLGFVDTNGTMVVKPAWDKVKGKGFMFDRCWVKNKSEKYWKLIDKKGNVIPTGQYDKVGFIMDINEGYSAVYQNDKLGFIDIKTGKEMVPCKYLGSSSFHEGLACVTNYGGTDERYGFINKTGDWVIPQQFKQAGHANFMGNGMCRATVSGKTVLINKKGEVVFKTNKGNIQGVYDEKKWVRVFTNSDRSGWGYINFKDEWMIEPVYNDLKAFNKYGYAMAQKGDLWGIIDTNNNVMVPFKYETIWYEPDKDGRILGAYPTKEPQSLINTPKDYYTIDFKPLDLSKYHYVYPADGSIYMRYQTEDKKIGYLNRDMTVAIKANYKKAGDFNDNRAWVVE